MLTKVMSLCVDNADYTHSFWCNKNVFAMGSFSA